MVWWVRDTGPGVPAEHAGEIFERFARGPQAADMEGSGLGLSIVRAIARAHGGDAELVEPRRVRPDGPAGGAAFVIRVPLRTAGASQLGGEQVRIDTTQDSVPSTSTSMEVP
jgi:signal transduction histidine kinase